MLRRVGAKVGAQILHSHFGHIGWRDRPAAERLEVRHFVSYYGYDLGKLPRRDPKWRARYREMFAGVHRVLCEGSCMAAAVVDLGCPVEKVEIQHLGIDLDRFAYRCRRWNGSGPLRVLCAAAFAEKKGLPFAMAALGLLQQSMDIEVTILGDAIPDPLYRAEKARILEAIEEAGIAPRLLGFQSHARLLEEARRHHVFLSPSITASDGDTEGGAPVSILEMAATGMPVVSTRHADIPEVLPEEKGGLLADERDVGGLVDLLQLLASHPGDWEARTAAIRRHIEEEYDVRRQATRLAELYRLSL
ncbi:MAG: glycosyltransferase [Planctomycetota bacterium]|jgi:colanic acid/amylovoran biosynthesis glycosyltransferase